MSHAAINWCRKSRGLTSTQKLVLLVLADSANAEFVCWNAATSIAEETSLSDRAVRTALHDLVEAGAISGEMRSGIRPLWTLNVTEGGEVFSAKRKGVPVSKRNHVPSNRKQVPLSNRNQVLSEAEPGSVKPEPRSVKAEPGSDEPSITTIEPSLNHKARGKPPAVVSMIPRWLDPEAWAAWCAHRKGKRWTDQAQALSIRNLAEFYAAGHDPRLVIEQSIASGWTGLFPLKGVAARAKPPQDRADLEDDLPPEMRSGGARNPPPTAYDFDGQAEEIA